MSYMQHDLNVSIKNICLIGRSIGTGVTVEFAHKYKWTNPIILISPYKTIIQVVTNRFSCLTQFVDKYPTIDYVKKLDCGIKIFHGQDDAIIPISHAIEISAAMKNKTFKPTFLINAGHNDILEHILLEEIGAVINCL